MEDHDWHLFDVNRHLEVKFEDGQYHIRNSKNSDYSVTLNHEEFDELRSGGPLPEGLE
jgi:hypothetical protein